MRDDYGVLAKYGRKIKILAVAPYEDMRPLLEKAGRSYSGLAELSICVGDLQIGVERARQMLEHEDFDLLLSRGGTARLLQKELSIPVASIPFSSLDMLRDVKRVERYAGKIAIVGVSDVTKNAEIVCDILQSDIRIVTIAPTDDIESVFYGLREDGYGLAICDLISFKAAQKTSFRAFFCSASLESITEGIDAALRLGVTLADMKSATKLLKQVLLHNDKAVVLLSAKKEILFSTIGKVKDGDLIMEILRKSPKIVREAGDNEFIRAIKGRYFDIERRTFAFDGEGYTVLFVSEKRKVFFEKKYSYVYRVKDAGQENGRLLNAFLWGDTFLLIRKYAGSKIPLLIVGEEGTGRERVAELLYREGKWNKKPFSVISCAEIQTVEMEKMLSEDDSPFASIDMAFFMKDFDQLGVRDATSFIRYAISTDFFKRNRVILSATLDRKHKNRQCEWLIKEEGAATIVLPSLRERIKESEDAFISLLALYIKEFDSLHGRQVIGFSQGAIDLLLAYRWPRNFTQLKHVVKEGVILADGAYIMEETVQKILNQEDKLMDSFVTVDKEQVQLHGRTLEDIDYEVARIVLKNEGGNKERTARRLGIGRTTLWRILKNHGNR